MKRFLLIVVVLAVLAAAAIWFFCSRGGGEGGARFAPADTVLYVSLPDVLRSTQRWPKTALAQIGADPSVADFLSQPLERLTAGGGAEAVQILGNLKPNSLFFAVTAVRENGAQIVLGFQYYGGRGSLDEALARLYREIGKKAPNATQSTSDYKGDTITALAAGRPLAFSATHGQWAFLSNNEAALQQTLDRAAGRGGSPALAGNGDFKKVIGHLSDKPDFLWYAQPRPVIDMLAQMSKTHDPSSPRQFEQMRKITALGGTLELDGANQKELAYILYPDASKLGRLNHGPMAFTTPETSIFFDSAMDTQTVASDAYYDSLPPEAREFFTNAKIDLKKVPDIMGTDIALMLDWPTSALVPNALVAAEIKDRPAAQNLLQAALTALGQDATSSESHGAAVYHFKGTQLVEPAIAVTDKFVIASLTAAEMDRVLSLQPGAPTLEGAASFKPALAAYGKAGMAFGFVDTKALFERIYNMLRPMAVIAGSMTPEIAEIVDVKKLPETGAISSHLSPIVYTCDQTGDGFQVESSGPITLSQALVLVMGAAFGSFAAQSMH